MNNDNTEDILDGLRKPQWETPVDPEGDAAYWRTRAESAEAELATLREQMQWIPVGERLPDDGQYVYARLYSGAISEWRYSTALESIFRRHYTHWLPRPEPLEAA